MDRIVVGAPAPGRRRLILGIVLVALLIAAI